MGHTLNKSEELAMREHTLFSNNLFGLTRLDPMIISQSQSVGISRYLGITKSNLIY